MVLRRICASIIIKHRLDAQIVLGLVLVASVGLLAWSLWPAPRQVQGFNVDSRRFPALRGTLYRLVLEWPVRLRVGERGQVTLRLEPLEQAGDRPTQEDSDGLLLEGRLEVDGLAVTNRQTAQTPLSSGGTAEVAWIVQAQLAGRYAGMVWSYLSPGSGGAGLPEPIGAQDIAVEATSVLGLTLSGARGLGLAGLVLSISAVYWVGTFRNPI